MKNLAIGFFALLALVCGAQAVHAAAEIGKPAPAFELKGSDDQTHKLSDYKGKVVVLYFHSTQCPWAKAYQPILNQDAAKFGPVEKDGKKVDRVVFLGVNSNAHESMEAINKSIKTYNTSHAILKDTGNQVADAYGGLCTPHIFIIDGDGVLRYSGGIEKAPDSPDDVGKSSEQYLVPAIQAIIDGKAPAQAKTVPMGCSIKKH